MFDTNEILIGSIGIVSTAASGFFSWFFTKRKYYAEVDGNLIENMQKSLDFYINLVEDNKARLEEVLERNNELERRDTVLESEVKELKVQLEEIKNNYCKDSNCNKRLKYTKPKNS